jgi:hypothetical protein
MPYTKMKNVYHEDFFTEKQVFFVEVLRKSN